jgi:PPP family 3-phenylpropionic acid transporter
MGSILFAACYSALVPLIDYAILTNLRARSNDYGRVRLWGSIGMGVAAWMVGLMIKGLQLNFVFFIYIILASLTALVAMRLPRQTTIEIESYWKSAKQYIHDRRWKVFLLGSVLAGTAHLFLGYYLFLFIRQLGADEAYIGFLVAVAAATNIIVFFNMPKLLQCWPIRKILVISSVLLVIRCLITAFIRDPKMGIVIQLMDGPTWSTMWAAGVYYANEIAPRGLAASSQALFNGVFMGLGGILSAAIGGIVYYFWGAKTLFQISAGFAVLGMLVFAFQQKPIFSLKPISSNE